MNLDWYDVEQAPQVVSHLLAGSLIINPGKEMGILINEVEVYGRREVDDCHREQLGLVKGFSRETSMPSTFKEHAYENVRPVVLSPREGGGKRLVIGTLKCDVLVTSCLRLDNKSISVGAETQIFPIGEQDALKLKIYLDVERVKEAKQFVKTTAMQVSKRLSVENIRQLRSRFDRLDTFNLARCSGPLTATSDFQPFTVFTLVNSFSSRQGVSYATALIFAKIAKAVIIDQGKASLSRTDVKNAHEACLKSVEYSSRMAAIVDLFQEGEDKIDIIGNSALSRILGEMATSLSTRISEANKTILKSIEERFEAV